MIELWYGPTKVVHSYNPKSLPVYPSSLAPSQIEVDILSVPVPKGASLLVKNIFNTRLARITVNNMLRRSQEGLACFLVFSIIVVVFLF